MWDIINIKLTKVKQLGVFSGSPRIQLTRVSMHSFSGMYQTLKSTAVEIIQWSNLS